MSQKDQLSRKFEELDFSDEPAMASQPGDDVRRGERLLRRRRVLWTAGVAATAVLATSAAVLLPGYLRHDATLEVAGGPDRTPTASPVPAPTEAPESPRSTPTESPVATPPPDDPFPYPATRQLLLDTAVEHLDPQREHLPDQSTNVQGGGSSVGTKLDWTVPGEDGLGMVKVFVTGPGASQGDGLDALQGDIGCGQFSDDGESHCTEDRIPGKPGKVWVAPADPEQDVKLGVLYERPDGSYVGISVHSLFGNNSTTPVSDVDITMAQAFAFVSDPDLKVVPGDDPSDRFDRPGIATEAPRK